MAIQQRPKFCSDLLPGREFDTPDEAETAEIEHKTRERAQQYIEAYPPYTSPKFNARMVDTIVHWELWSLGKTPEQQAMRDDECPPSESDPCSRCNGKDIDCPDCHGTGDVYQERPE